MAQLSVLLDRVHDELPAVPELMALRALSDAAKEFCTRTHAWQDTLTSIQLREGVAVYDVDLDTGVQLAALKEVRLDGQKIDPIAAELPRRVRQLPGEGAVACYVQVSPTSIQVFNTPLEAGTLTVKAALTLALGEKNADIPDALIDEYGEAIAAGAKMRLVRLAGQPWFAPDAVALYAPPYYAAITSAKFRTMTSLGEADLQVQMRGW